jgi:lysophospholipase L1-like esterase
VQLNRELASMYPDNFIDIRTWLVSRANPSNPQDLAHQNEDMVPASLLFDEIHLNNDGSILVAQRVRDWLDAKGW